MKISVKTDVSEFKQLLIDLNIKMPAASVVGVTAAMEEFKKDCLEVVPKVPFKTGFLHDHHEILPTKIVGSLIIGTLKVPGPYAASIHEGISRWGTSYKYKTPGTGAKWIQSKMLKYVEKYVKIAGSVVRRFFGGIHRGSNRLH